MERAAALKVLGRLLGKSLGYRVDMQAPRREERDAARMELKEACQTRDALDKQVRERADAVLSADVEYQRLKAERTDARKRYDELMSITNRYRFTVGNSNSIFFHVKAQGDSWEEVIAILTQKKVA